MLFLGNSWYILIPVKFEQLLDRAEISLSEVNDSRWQENEEVLQNLPATARIMDVSSRPVVPNKQRKSRNLQSAIKLQNMFEVGTLCCSLLRFFFFRQQQLQARACGRLGLPECGCSSGLRLWPHQWDSEGFFVACIKKQGGMAGCFRVCWDCFKRVLWDV